MMTAGPARLKMLALDLDDTLLKSDLSISYRVRNTIKQTEPCGVTVVLASSRIPEVMDKYSKLLGLHKRAGYLVCNNGALIMESNTANIVHEAKLERDIALAICDLADAEGFPVQLYEDDIMYVSRKNDYSSYDENMTGIRQVVVENFRAMVSDGCYKLIVPGEPEILKHVEILVRALIGRDCNLFASRPYYLEILPKKTDKCSALAMIAEKIGIRAEEVLAIGASINDEAMLRWAGIGVAMANGDEKIKSVANFITDSTNDDDGVAEVIEKYLFCRR